MFPNKYFIKNLFTATIFLIFLNLINGNIETKTYELDSPSKDLIWCGASQETVLILTENNSLYRSDDKGFNWRLLNGILNNTGKGQLEENDNEVNFFYFFHINFFR